MFSIIGQLLTPFRYLRIELPLKWKVDFGLPLVLGGVMTALVLTIHPGMHLFGEGGFVELFTNLLRILVGFYIAALAAVATFQSPTLDQRLDGDDAILPDCIRGVPLRVKLTRRRFLSLLFGHLAVMAIFLYFIGGFAALLSEGLNALVSEANKGWMKALFIFVYSTASAHLLTVTLLGLFYLSYRIHRSPSGYQLRGNESGKKRD